MIGRTNSVGGSRYLVNIAAYATEGAIPSAGTLGRLAVVTSSAIPSWLSGGIMMKSSLPSVRDDGTALQENDLCIIESYASNTPFQIVKGVTVYPIACFQRASSAWVERVAKFDNGTSWVPLYLYLYYFSNQCVSVTGGWQNRAWAAKGSIPAVAATISVGSNYVDMSITATTASSVYEIITDFDLTNFSSLVFDGYSNHNGSALRGYVFIVPRSGTYWLNDGSSGTYAIQNATRGTMTIDVSALNGSYDIGIGLATVSYPTVTAAAARMYSIKLVP